MIKCLNCHAETSNGLALCELCQRQVQLAMVYLPIHFRNLSRWQPGRAGGRPVPGSVVLYDGTTRGTGTGDRISDRLDEAANMLTTWARALADDRPHLARLLDRLLLARAEERITEAQAMAWLCKGFGRFLPSVATLDWCGEFVRDVTRHEAALNGLNDLVPGWYAGACRHCQTPTSVIPGLTWVTCGGCGATTYARDHLDVVLSEARDWLARPKVMAEAIVALVDTEPSVRRLYDRIRQWSNRGDLTAVRRVSRDYEWSDDSKRMEVADVEVGHARYRMGDVLDLALRDTRSLDSVRVS